MIILANDTSHSIWLLRIKFELIDPLVALDTWLQEINMCAWNLFTTIPPNLCIRDSSLQQLFLADNDISGDFPEQILNCSSLHVLDLSGNSIGGPLPTGLDRLQRLTDLLLNNNTFSGEIPPQIGSISSLNTLFLFGNTITGRIPPEIGKLQQLTTLYLYDNQMSGLIPGELTNCSSLESLNFFENRLPQEASKIVLANNKLSGSIPATFGFLSELLLITLDNNSLSGTIPESLHHLKNLSIVYFSYNRLSGSIAPLSGSNSLTKLDLTNNSFSGSIPSTLSTNLIRLRLANKLTGQLQMDLSGLTSLEHFLLGNNRLYGPIPTWLGSITELGELDLSSNSLSASIPPEIGNCSKLLKLSLHSNMLSGPIPPEIGKLDLLNVLNLQRNNLSTLSPLFKFLMLIAIAGIIVRELCILSQAEEDNYHTLLTFTALAICCTSCGARIKHKLTYYWTKGGMGARYCFCTTCFKEACGCNIGSHFPKQSFTSAKTLKNLWLQCDRYERGPNQICALYNSEWDLKGKMKYICPFCRLAEIKAKGHVPIIPVPWAQELPRIKLSDDIEQRLLGSHRRERK
ncbi:hypothetical protein OROHE_009417 [Orobanche hederae]